MTLNLEATVAGVILPVQVTAKARQNAITGIHQGRLKVSITQSPEKGKANQALIKFLSKELKIRKSQISVVSGETSPLKKLLVEQSDLIDLEKNIESFFQTKSD